MDNQEIQKIREILPELQNRELEYENLLNLLCKVSGAKYGAFNLFTTTNGMVRNVAVHAENAVLNAAQKILGFEPSKKLWKESIVNIREVNEIGPRKFEKLAHLAEGVLSEAVCSALEKVFNLGYTYILKVADEQHFVGDFILLFEKGKELQNTAIVVAYVDLIGMAVSRNRISSALMTSENRFRGIFENSTIGLYRSSPGGKVLLANPALIEILGYSSFEELAKINISKDGYPDPSQRKNFKELIEQNGEVKGFESTWRKQNGEIIYVRESAKAYYNEEGIIEYYEGTCEDITSQKLMEKELNKNSRFMKDVLDNLLDPVVITDHHGNITFTSEAVGQLGYSTQELMGLNIKEIVHADEQAHLLSSLADLADAPEGLQREFRIKSISGDYVWYEAKGKVLNDREHNNTSFIFSGRNVNNRKIAEQKYLSARRTYEDVYNSLTEAIYILDENYTFIDVNRGAEIMYGFSREELIGKNPALVAAPGLNNMEDILQQMNQVTQTGKSARFDFWATRKTGETFLKDVIISRATFFGKDTLIATARDITLEKLNEVNLQKSEADLKAIIENSFESIWLIDSDYIIQYVNAVFYETYLRYTGIRLEKGKNKLELIPEPYRAAWKEKYDRVFRNEKLIFLDVLTVGSEQLYVEFSMSPVVMDGKVIGAACYGKDITENKVAENEILYQSEFRKLLIDLSSNFINLPLQELETAILSSLEKLGKFSGADRAFIVEYDYSRQVTKNPAEWCRPGLASKKAENPEVPLNTLPEAIQIHCKGASYIVENTSLLDESPFAEMMRVHGVKSFITVPLMDQGCCQGFTGFESVEDHHYTIYDEQLLKLYSQIVVNVRKRQETETSLIIAKERAEESNQLKSAFLANMSHEIRTPMNGILGFLQIMQKMDYTSEKRNTYFDVVNKSGQRLLKTINDIIEMSKIEAGHVEVILSEFSIEDIMNYHLTFYRPQVESKNIALVCRETLTGDEAVIRTDRHMIEGILTNLINNAMKFTSQGTISIGNYLKGDQLVMYVRDTGIGIPADRLEAVFDRFVQADLENNRPHEGSGLGLSICKAYAELMGGEMNVESVEGTGSVFSLILPYAPQQKKQVEVNAEQTAQLNLEPRHHILVAEDDDISYLLIKNALISSGVKIDRAINGVETIRMVKENPDFTLVLLDLRMPEMSGLDAAREIRKFNTQIPLIAQTAYALSRDRDLVFEAGCDDYITKPIDLSDLWKKINLILNTRTRPSN